MSPNGFWTIATASFLTVFVAELVGDKSLYAISSLASRHDGRVVLAGVATAFMGKMGIAVALGHQLARIPPPAVALASACGFLGSGALLWRRESRTAETLSTGGWHRAGAVSFASLFLTEWGDAGQLAAAALAVQVASPLAVWLGATVALCAKAALAVGVGVRARSLLPVGALRIVAAACCCLLATLSLLKLAASW
ncbi:MAG TPA: TMEM165/GDT1 family protein [Thermoanaerobaculia bacterium]|jgi:putative Ca2+/H+ antiporter (TMEM165/GDT1 family)|nr:TMEM165/GDT1 family protein [Thermoanaerobaculia bacterium]